jgi:hypothetical protein
MAGHKAARWVLALCCVASSACSGQGPSSAPAPAGAPLGLTALQKASILASRDATLTRLLAASEEGFRPEGDGITSPGWRAAARGRFDALGARVPMAADGILEVGVSRLERLQLHVTFEGARAALATVDRGRVSYAETWPSTDAIVATTPTRLEMLLLLRDSGAPSDFRWGVRLPRGLVGSRPDDLGGLFFVDGAGRAALHVPPPFAIDAAGAKRSSSLALRDRALSVHLDTAGLVFPVLLDPAIETAFWEEQLPKTSPPPRNGLAMAYDSARQKVVMFGGSGPLADTWEWNGKDWTERCMAAPCNATGNVPPARAGHSMAYDAAHARTVLFGGDTMPMSETQDTWLWDGVKWTAVCGTGCTPPPVRAWAALAYDERRSRTVLFGGNTWVSVTCGYSMCPMASPYADTWEWVGTTWNQVMPMTPPGASYALGMAYDSKQKVSVLFGGLNASAMTTNETWAWDGTNWAEACTAAPCDATLPPARSDFAMAYDSVRHKTVVFGGSGPSDDTWESDTWEWDGAAWDLTTQGLSPPGRTDSAMVFDEATGSMLLFGGEGATSALSDTWEYHSHGGACTADTQCDTEHCVDGVCCETVCGVCSRCDQVASLVPGPPLPGPVASPGVCSPVTNGPDSDSCKGDRTCDPTGACKGGPGYPCKGDPDCASGSCQGGCCDGATCVEPDAGSPAADGGMDDEAAARPDGGQGSSPRGSAGGCGCRVARADDRVGRPSGASLLLALVVFAERRRRRGLAAAAALGGCSLVASCSLATPLGELTADWHPDGGEAGDAGKGHPRDAAKDVARDAGRDVARDTGHDAPPADAGPPPHPALWSYGFGDSKDQYVYGVAIDAAGDILIAGAFAGHVNFGPGGVLSSNGGLDAFVAMLDPNGQGIWSHSFGDVADAGAQDQLAYSVAVDPTSGEVLVVGAFEGSINLGTSMAASQGGQDAFYVKLDATGTIEWSGTAGGIGDQVAWGAGLNTAGYAFVTGAFEEGIEVGGTLYGSGAGFDGWSLGLTSGGGVSWVTLLVGGGDALGTSLAVDPSGNPYVGGYFSGTAAFVAADGGSPTAAGAYDGFVYGLQPTTGKPGLPQLLGVSANTYTYGVAVDGLGPGHIAVAGPFQGKIASFPGAPLVSAGQNDVFVGEFEVGGTPLWGRSFGDAEDQIAYGVAIDPGGNVVVTGSMKGGAKVGPFAMESAGENDVFLARFDPDGKPLWGERFGDALDQEGTALATTVDGSHYDIVLVGNLQGTIDFGKGTLTSQGGSDFFVAKIRP